MKNKNKNRVFRFNRRIRKLTDYKLRLRLLKSSMTRVVVRKSNKNMLIQFVDYIDNSDKIISSAKSTELKKYGFTLNTGNLSSAYLTGYLVGKKMLKKKFNSECIVDFGLQNSNLRGSKLYSAIAGVSDSGIKVRVSKEVFPDKERIAGAHLSVKDAKNIIEITKKNIEGIK